RRTAVRIDRLELYPVQTGREALGAFAREGGKILLQLANRLSVGRDGRVDLRPFAEIVEDLFQTFKTEPLNQIFHHQRGFVVGKLQVQIALRRQKRRAQLAD